MVFKRYLFKKKQLLLKHNFKKYELQSIIEKSLLRNHYNNYIFRLSFSFVKEEKMLNESCMFFKTYQKLICPFTLCNKVPSQRFLFSRFYINKHINTLKLGNVFK